MKIKVGQWARYKIKILRDDDYEDYIYGISKIKEYDQNVKFGGCVTFEDGGERYGNNIIKTADNLEDLLEIGDIVHFKTLNGTGELIIKTEDRLNYLKFCVFDKKMIVTAIELHENRQIQRIGGI